MKLLIHDYDQTEWNQLASAYEGWKVLSDHDRIHPCVGCFGCWLKTPCECGIKDGYEIMPRLLHQADEVLILSRYTYGGFSSFVKNVLDRSIAYNLPFFRIYQGEMHHQPRYKEVKPLRVVFRGHGLTAEAQACARNYVEAVCKNLNAELRELRFEDCAQRPEPVSAGALSQSPEGKTLFLNCSLRGANANTNRFLDVIATRVTGDVMRCNLPADLSKLDELSRTVASAQKVVLGIPLYVDGVPSAPLRLMELLEKAQTGRGKKVYVVSNMGFYESRQIQNLLAIMKNWCGQCGYAYCGGIAIGAGEMMGQVIQLGNKGPGKKVYESLLRFGEAIESAETIPDLYTETNKFPRFLYFLAADSGMKKTGKSNGLKRRDLLVK